MRSVTRRLSALIVISCLFAPRFVAAQTARVELIRAPEGGLQPQACVDVNGMAHLVYGKSADKKGRGPGDLFYVRMKPGEKQFSRPIRVNSDPGGVLAVGTTGGGQIAVGKAGRVHVVWNGPNPKSKVKVREAGEGKASQQGKAEQHLELKPLLCARLNDAASAFEERNVAGRTEALDGAGTVAADREGNVYVLWHARGPKKGERFRAVYMVHSSDEGKTFGSEVPVNPTVTGACSCCSMRATVDAQGRLYAAYRAAGDGTHRDSLLLYASHPGSSLEQVTLGEWSVSYCPASSYGLASAAKGTLAAWEQKDQIYFAEFDAQTRRLADPVLVGGEGRKRKYPVIVANAQGQKLLAWTEGVSWSIGGSVAWQLYDMDNAPVGAKGESLGVPASSQVTAFARPNGDFAIVY